MRKSKTIEVIYDQNTKLRFFCEKWLRSPKFISWFSICQIQR